jgi:uncharacterized protein (TIGR02246 family)
MKYFLFLFIFISMNIVSGFSQEKTNNDTLPLPAGAWLYPNLPEFQVYGKPATAEDEKAIYALLQQFGKAWGSGDVEGATASYADDVEWTNAFGVIVKGTDNLRNYFKWLFSRDTATTGGSSESRNSKFISLRYLGDNVAIYHGMTLSSRGVSRSGEDTRRNHITFVLAKKDGKWRIAQQMIMDERDWN